MKPYTDIEQSRLNTITQEEKAKRYDVALKKAKEYWDADIDNTMSVYAKGTMEHLFPELRESDDERIKKWLIDTIKQIPDSSIEWENISKSDVLAWLEKQGNKPADKFEPKFKVGDWVVQENIGVYKVIEICESWYEVIDGEDNHYSISFDKEYMCHLWDIAKDAKDGDVLACNEEILLSKSCSVQGRISIYCWYNGRTNDFFSKEVDDVSITTRNKICPATKEQRDLLFQKMREASYEFDFDKKELKN